MTIEEIFSHIFAHKSKGLMVHDQLAAAFLFLNLPGYSKCHEYHYFEESGTRNRLREYYLRHHNKLILEEKFEPPTILPTNWYQHMREEVDINTKRAAIKDLMQKWVNWEQETLQLLSSHYKNLCDLEEYEAAFEIKYHLEDVGEELARAREKQNDLEMLGYNLEIILPEQEKIYKKYSRMMKND